MITKIKDDYMRQETWYRCECGQRIEVPFHLIRLFYNDQKEQKRFNEIKCKKLWITVRKCRPYLGRGRELQGAREIPKLQSYRNDGRNNGQTKPKKRRIMPYELNDFLDDLYTRLDEIEYDIKLIRKQLTENWFEIDKDKLIESIECVKDDAECLYNLVGQTYGPYLRRNDQEGDSE